MKLKMLIFKKLKIKNHIDKNSASRINIVFFQRLIVVEIIINVFGTTITLSRYAILAPIYTSENKHFHLQLSFFQ